MKGKSSVNPTRPTAIEASDESSSSSSNSKSDIYVSDKNDSNSEKSDAEDEDDFEVARMTEVEARRMFKVEVMSDMGQVQKLRVLPHQNQREYLIPTRTMRTTMNSQSTFQPLRESLSSQK